MEFNKLSSFARAYIECALWSSNDESTPNGGEPMDKNYSIHDFDPETLARMVKEADRFAEENKAAIESANISDSRAGHCFWLNRNDHGSGFWDEKTNKDPEIERVACDLLDESSKRAGSRDLYIGDDGMIYLF